MCRVQHVRWRTGIELPAHRQLGTRNHYPSWPEDSVGEGHSERIRKASVCNRNPREPHLCDQNSLGVFYQQFLLHVVNSVSAFRLKIYTSDIVSDSMEHDARCYEKSKLVEDCGRIELGRGVFQGNRHGKDVVAKLRC